MDLIILFQWEQKHHHCFPFLWNLILTREPLEHHQKFSPISDCLILAGVAIYGKKDVFLGVPPEGVTGITLDAGFAMAVIAFILSTAMTGVSTYLILRYHILDKQPWPYMPKKWFNFITDIVMFFIPCAVHTVYFNIDQICVKFPWNCYLLYSMPYC